MKSTIPSARTLTASIVAAILSQACLHAQPATPLKGVVGDLPKGIIQVIDFEPGDLSQASVKEGGTKEVVGEQKSILYFDELHMGGAKTTRDEVDPAKQK